MSLITKIDTFIDKRINQMNKYLSEVNQLTNLKKQLDVTEQKGAAQPAPGGPPAPPNAPPVNLPPAPRLQAPPVPPYAPNQRRNVPARTPYGLPQQPNYITPGNNPGPVLAPLAPNPLPVVNAQTEPLLSRERLIAIEAFNVQIDNFLVENDLLIEEFDRSLEREVELRAQITALTQQLQAAQTAQAQAQQAVQAAQQAAQQAVQAAQAQAQQAALQAAQAAQQNQGTAVAQVAALTQQLKAANAELTALRNAIGEQYQRVTNRYQRYQEYVNRYNAVADRYNKLHP